MSLISFQTKVAEIKFARHKFTKTPVTTRAVCVQCLGGMDALVTQTNGALRLTDCVRWRVRAVHDVLSFG